MRRLTTGEIQEAVGNGGGSSLTIRLRFVDGQRALFKPAQRLPGSNHRAEIAAYHLDRLLGLGRVAPAAGRPLSLRWLQAQLAGDPATQERLTREALPAGDRLEGALIAWHTPAPVVAEPPRDWVEKLNPPGPLQGAENGLAWSDMVLFDALIDNTDRWSGGNVMTLGPGGPVIFLDNASAFLGYRARQHAFLSRPLGQLCRFRKGTVQALRRLGASAPGGLLSDALRSSLRKDPLAPLLDEVVLAALEERHERILQHLQRCEQAHGAEAFR